MSHSVEGLKKMTVAQLREIAEGLEHTAVEGYTQMRKADLFAAICTALGVAHEGHDVVGIDKAKIKQQIHALKTQRDTALEAHDSVQLRRVRRKIHRLKRQIRRAAV